jgi:hypothetical protein
LLATREVRPPNVEHDRPRPVLAVGGEYSKLTRE